MPNAIMETVNPVRSLLLRMERNDNEKMSLNLIKVESNVQKLWDSSFDF